MPKKSAYKGDHQAYVSKLKTVLEKKLGLTKTDYDYDYGRHGGWVRFTFGGDKFYLEHTIQKAADQGITLSCGKDAFAQLVLTLEDVIRAHNRGVYPLKALFSEMIALPAPKEIPLYFRMLGFTDIPNSEEEVKAAFRNLAKLLHPDKTNGVSTDAFKAIKQAEQDALAYLGKE